MKTGNLREDYIEQLNSLRSGPVGEKILTGLNKVLIGGEGGQKC